MRLMLIRVAIIIPRLAQLGPVKVIQNLVNSLYTIENLHITVYYLDKIVDPHVKMMVKVERLIPGRFRFSDFDIIHTNGIRPDLFAFINRRKIRYHISTIHNFVFDDLRFTYNRLISWVFGNVWLSLWNRADKLVCVSGAMKNYYKKWFSISKLEVIYNGIAEADNSCIPGNDIIQAINRFKSKGLKIIGAVGILTKIKGIDQILSLLAEEKEFALVIIGSGKELPNLLNLAKKLNIHDRCLFCGFRSNAVTYFRFFDYIIVPSKSEGFGLVLIEAVQQKVPVICSDLEIFKELFNRDEVIFFKLDNTASLASALKTAVETGKAKAELAYIRYKNEYSDRDMAKKYFNLYLSV
jgi:L-malate glycosyltransferase